MGHVDLNSSLVLVRVAQAGSFRGAAKLLDMPKTSVSRKVAELEARLGVQLLRRTTRKLSLTDAGISYVEGAQLAIAHLEAAEDAVSQHQREPVGRIRMTAPAPMGQSVLSKILSEFLLKYPKVEIQLRLTYRPVDLLTERFDVALRYGTLADSSLVAIPLSVAEQRIVASPTYLKTYGTPKTPADLASHQCVLFGSDSAMRATWSLKTAKRAHEVTVRGRLMTDDLLAIRQAALSGLGLARLPQPMVAEELTTGKLVAVLEPYTTATTPLNLLHPGGKFLPPRTRALIDFLKERLSVPRAR